MQKISLVLFAVMLVFSSCKKEDDDEIKDLPGTPVTYLGSFEVDFDGITLTKATNDVFYVNDYEQVNIYGLDLQEVSFSLLGTGFGQIGVDVPVSDDSAIIFTYKNVLYMSTTGTMTRIDNDHISIDCMVSPSITGENAQSLVVSATIGRFEDL